MIDVLLVEPDKILGATYKHALQSAGYKIAVQAHAQTAIHSVDKQKPKVIVTELQLAEHNGVEFLYELRSYPDWQNIPVIILTSVPPNDSGLSSEAQKQLNIVRYCYKPATTLTNLIEYVNELMQR